MPSLASRLLSPLLVLQSGPSTSIDGSGTARGSQTADVTSPTTYAYSVVDGFFRQSSPSFPTNDPTYDPLQDSFGLIDKSSSRWKRFKRDIKRLNEDGEERTSVKVLFLARHGQGYHNVAESKYGTPAWNSYWSKLDGDGEITWGPDALLTPLGENQARAVNRAWKEQRDDDAPLPTSLYSSPLSRAASTLKITWEGVLLGVVEEGTEEVKPVFKEKLREVMGVHTCDQRRDKTYLHSSYPTYSFEPGFAEEDELWSPIVRETDDELDKRIQAQLDEIFSTDNATYVSITAHGGVIGGFFRVLGHRKIAVPPGGMVPIVVQARR
ncbi:hypothetical protein JCM8547_001032 [Rhodosporidiobolus lusitaniae]